MQVGFSSGAYTASESARLSFEKMSSCKAFADMVPSRDNVISSGETSSAIK